MWHSMCASIHQAVLQHSSVSYNLTQFWCYLTEESARCHWLRARSQKTAHSPSFRCQVQVLVVTGASEPPPITSLGLINLLEGLTDLRKKFYLLSDHFIIKEYKSGTTRYTEQGMGEGAHRFHTQGVPLFQQLPMSTNSEGLWTPYLRAFKHASLGRHDRLNHRWLTESLTTGDGRISSCSCFPRGLRGRGWSPWRPTFRDFTKATSLT